MDFLEASCAHRGVRRKWGPSASAEIFAISAMDAFRSSGGTAAGLAAMSRVYEGSLSSLLQSWSQMLNRLLINA